LAKNIRHLINYYLTIILTKKLIYDIYCELSFQELLKLVYNAGNQYGTIQIKKFQLNKKM